MRGTYQFQIVRKPEPHEYGLRSPPELLAQLSKSKSLAMFYGLSDSKGRVVKGFDIFLLLHLLLRLFCTSVSAACNNSTPIPKRESLEAAHWGREGGPELDKRRWVH